MNTLTVEEILAGTGMGRMQSVGQMAVIPILDDGDAQDESFAPPDFNIGTSHYGTVEVENTDPERPTIVPTGAGWVTKESAQDHAVPGSYLVPAGKMIKINTAMCIEQTQGGYISKKAHEMLVIPASLRAAALAKRKVHEYGKLWPAIREFNNTYGITGSSHLVYFLNQFKKELDEFVAEFELVPRQIGAIVIIGNYIIGVERAPTIEFWKRLWTPLIRVCYGSLAVSPQFQKDTNPPSHRIGLDVRTKSLAGIASALAEASVKIQAQAQENWNKVAAVSLTGKEPDMKLGPSSVYTVADQHLAGQIVKRENRIPYASLCSTGITPKGLLTQASQ